MVARNVFLHKKYENWRRQQNTFTYNLYFCFFDNKCFLISATPRRPPPLCIQLWFIPGSAAKVATLSTRPGRKVFCKMYQIFLLFLIMQTGNVHVVLCSINYFICNFHFFVILFMAENFHQPGPLGWVGQRVVCMCVCHKSCNCQ